MKKYKASDAIVLQIGPEGRLYNAEGGRRVWESVEEAVAAASSLARSYPNRTFYVWVPVAMVQSATLPVNVTPIVRVSP